MSKVIIRDLIIILLVIGVFTVVTGFMKFHWIAGDLGYCHSYQNGLKVGNKVIFTIPDISRDDVLNC